MTAPAQVRMLNSSMVFHISFSHLPLESETHCLWGLHPRNESRVGLSVNNEYTQIEHPLTAATSTQICLCAITTTYTLSSYGKDL